jgi:hypothetical protein
MVRQITDNTGHFMPRKTVILSQLNGPVWTTQDEDGLAPSADHVHIHWPMIVRMYCHAQSVEPQDCAHVTQE